MSQPTQITGLGYSGEFIVVDNSAAPSFPSPNFTKESLGYDTTAPGAAAQGQNKFGNGTVPDAANPLVLYGTPLIVQKHSASSTGSVASLANAFGSNNTSGNAIVVVCGVGNGTAPTISDTQSNSYIKVAQIANGTALNVAIFIVPSCAAGANTVTVNNGGAAASIASEIYEVSGLVASALAIDGSGTNTSTANAASPAVTITPSQSNEISFAAFGLGTAAQTITPSYNNDSGQLNPTTPAGLFSFVGASVVLPSTAASSPSATAAVAEPWAVAVAAFKSTSVSQTTKTGLNILNQSQGLQVYFKNPA